MIDDVTRQIGAVGRQVGQRDHAGKLAKVVTVTQSYDASIEDVWDACTSAERLPRWFLPVSGDLRLGGRFQLEGNAGGEILSCEPPRRIAATWEYGDMLSWIEIRLSEEPDGRTRFELEHIAHVDAHWDEFGPGAVGVGWDMALTGLSAHLVTKEAVDPAAAMEWAASDQGKAFVTLSSEGWCAANIAAGENEETATAAAKRTTAAYTGAAPTEHEES